MIFDLFSKRQQALRKDAPDILLYDVLPNPLRVQIVHIVSDAIGVKHAVYRGNPIENAYKFIHDALCREYGIFDLATERTYEERICNFIIREPSIDRTLDAVEFCLRYIDRIIREDRNYNNTVTRNIKVDDAIIELNERFKQHAIGFQYESEEIIKVDSTYVHSEIVRPTLMLLSHKKFKGANEEYLKAHEHYRHGRNKECLAECLKAFESTMKIIFDIKGWKFDSKLTSSGLVKICFDNNLVPLYLQSQFTSLRSLLESGVATIRNRVGGHGQGITPTTADDETTRFTLSLTGACIIYLIELSKL